MNQIGSTATRLNQSCRIRLPGILRVRESFSARRYLLDLKRLRAAARARLGRLLDTAAELNAESEPLISARMDSSGLELRTS